MLAIGEDGQVITFRDGTVYEEAIIPKPVCLRGLGVVDGFAVACGMDRQVYRRTAVGAWESMHAPQVGTLLCGRNKRWKTIKLTDFDDDIWDLQWFGGHLYISTMRAVYQLSDDGIEPAPFCLAAPTACYRLTAEDGVLWSVGAADVFAFDGTTWTRADWASDRALFA